MKATTTLIRSAAVAAIATVGLIIPAGAVGADEPYPGGGTPPEVLPNRIPPRATQPTSTSTLPLTGTDAAELAAIAGAAVGVGVVLVRRNRRTAGAI
ncbi:MAG: LPXTG cell wall anchor domain-containing protein [Acidimicrobiia bacterium]|nr:LPXTG cell wall anchor domain-containing protein [Acidimicrobiia bacterium]